MENLVKDKNEPYLKVEVKKLEYRYNPEYGDERICKCGHSYYRHFDTYENMSAVGCKYCECNYFVDVDYIGVSSPSVPY